MPVRSAFLFIVGFAAIITAAAATETPRAPGAYTSLTTPDAAACARACAEDGICMAWTFRADNQCDLSAVLGATANPHAIAAGFSSRAPALFQHRTPIVQPTPLDTQAPEPQHVTATDTEDAPNPALENDETMLLGGPLDGDLRLGLQ